MWTGRINYLIFFSVGLFGLLFYHHYVMMIWVAGLLVMPVISYFLTKNTLKHLTADITCNRREVGKLAPVILEIKVKNHWLIPIEHVKVFLHVQNGFFENKKEYEFCMPVFSYSERNVSMELQGEYCGRIVADITRVKIFDVLGLFSFEKQLHATADYFIMPETILELPRIQLSSSGVTEDVEVQYTKGDDVSQISIIRDYIPGDKLQNIHWKLSAKKEELQVKEYSKPYSDYVMLLVELAEFEGHPEITDGIIEAFYGCGKYLLKQGRRFRCSWFHQHSGELVQCAVETEEEFAEVLQQLFFMNLYKEPHKAYEYYQGIHGEEQYTTVYLAGPGSEGLGGQKIPVPNEKVVMLCFNG